MNFWTGVASFGLGMQAFGAYSQGKAERDALNAQAALQEYNARVAEQDAIAADRKRQFDQFRQIYFGEKRLGRVRALAGHSGTLVGEGANLQIQARQAFENELENALIGYEGETQVRRFKSQATGYRTGAQYARARGENAYRTGLLDTGSTILSGLGNMHLQGMFG